MAPKRILIVEGQAAFATAHAAEVEKAGYEAVLVHNGAAAVRALQQDSGFGALMVDLNLPDTTGLAWLRANPDILDHYPVILTTADASLATAVDAMRIGAFDYLVKPIASARLASALSVALSQGRVAPPKIRPRSAKSTAKDRPGGFIGTSPPDAGNLSADRLRGGQQGNCFHHR